MKENRNHKILKAIECLKCGETYEWLLYKSFCIERQNHTELDINFINRVFPCLTNEETIIKKLLE